MFERFSEKARRTIFFGRHYANKLGASYIESEHLLLGLLRENRNLLGDGVAEEIFREITARAPGLPAQPSNNDIPLSAEVKQALKLADDEARKLGHKVVGPAHLMLGMIGAEQCRAAKALEAQGFDAVKFRNQMVPPSQSDFEGRNYV
jgi:ATP-dependent Clp protease ATP-binding subunit ClpC